MVEIRMTANPLFSILIANYNNGQYIEESIQSVYNQTYTNWEIIIIDDASTDNSKEIINNCIKRGVNIRSFINAQNLGCGASKMKISREAKGEICGFLDSDDALLSDALKVMVDTHLRYPETSLVFSRHNLCNENLDVLWTSEIRSKDESLNYLRDREHSIEHFASYKQIYYRKTPGINPRYKRAVDQDLYYKLEEVGKVKFIDDITYNYRLHKGGISQLDYKALFWHLIVVRDACERREINPEDIADRILKKNIFHFGMKHLNVRKKTLFSKWILIIMRFTGVFKKPIKAFFL